MIVIEGTTVDHFPGLIDHKHDHAIALCDEEGEPVDKDPDEIELCSRCRSSIDDPESRLPDGLSETDEDDGNNGD